MMVKKLFLGAFRITARFFASAVFLVILAILLSPRIGSLPERPELLAARTIALAMYQYANDNDLHYPTGKSSTEVCQKLLDGKYITDGSLFYVPMNGKRKYRAGPLKPENVCFDVTGSANTTDSDGLPLVFTTGFKIEYKPGGQALFLGQWVAEDHRRDTWWQQFWVPKVDFSRATIAVADVSNSVRLFGFTSWPTVPPTIPNVVPVDFNAKGKTYVQLTPEGILRP